MMNPDEAVTKALGRMAELLVEGRAKMSLNDVVDLLDELASEIYQAGYADAIRALDERDREAAEHEFERWYREVEPEE